jgi:hypothetical protein
MRLRGLLMVVAMRRERLARRELQGKLRAVLLLPVLACLSLTAAGSAPAVTLSPTSLNFGSVVVGTTSAVKNVTLINSGSAPLTISGISVTGPFTETNTCGTTVAPRQKCTISVTFSPINTGVATGAVTITDNASNSPQTVSLSGTGSTTGLTSIAITPANPSVAVGATQQFTATGTFSGGRTYNLTDSVTWNSSKKTIATVSDAAGTQGLATAVAAGTTTISATTSKIVGSTVLTVTIVPTLVSIVVSPTSPSIVLGTQQQFIATGNYSDGSIQILTTSVTWTSGTTAVATISNTSGSQGLATSVAVGTSAITAALGSVTSPSDTLTVNAAIAGESVTTYHYDNYRTGWDQNEAALNPGNVNTSSFGLLHTVTLDNQVDAQPLVVPGVNITAGNFQGTHDVVYVVTENDTVYAVDAESGTILLSPNFGPPVLNPTGCQAPYDGINSTPAIDLTNHILYVMVYTNQATGPAYYLHALDLGSLTDTVTPELVTASHTLTDGSTFDFNATYQRQRPALLMANGNVYAAFGSFCNSNSLSRGWLLGWQTGTLTPMSAVEITDTQATDKDDFFASSIWMSGYGPAADDSGNILFVTGNSDPSGTTYDGVTNIQESVIKEAPDLSSVLDLFTPSNWASLDEGDRDFGSGGVMVLPDQPGAIPHLAVAAGKDGRMFLMNEDSLGGYSTKSNNVLGTYAIGWCWCGESYYVDPTDLTPRVVTSGNATPEVWKLQTTPSVSLTMVTSGTMSSGGQDPGFFTTISSDGMSNPIIWALGRPLSTSQPAITLYAFNPDAGGSTMPVLFQAAAGSWPNIENNANLVPVVANGEVFVASYQQLQIFGLLSAKSKAAKKK